MNSILLQIGLDPLGFEIDPQAISDVPVDIDREILGGRGGFALQAQSLERDAAAAERVGIGVADPLAEHALLEDPLAVELPSAACRRDRQQPIVIDLRQRRILVRTKGGFGPQPFEGYEEILVRTFVLCNRREGFAVALEPDRAHPCALGHKHTLGRREVAGIELRAIAKSGF